jgi:hypothetical protein
MDSQTTAFVLGMIGAAAWVPQIVSWAAKLLSKPSVRILPGATVELGFTNYGPIFNFPIVILVKHKDALITRMRLEVVHQNGERHLLEWMWLHEVMSVFRGLPANVNLSKQDRAIALVATLAAPLSKTIGFQDTSFQEAYRKKVTDLTEQYRFLQVQQNGKEEFLKSRELAQTIEWFQKSIFWKEGEYQLHLEALVDGLASPVRTTFRTNLTAVEADLLRQNGQKIVDYVTAVVNADPKGPPPAEPAWYWVNPTLSSAILQKVG